MPKQSSVNVAYAPVGGGKPQSSSKCRNFCISLIFTICLVTFLFTGTGNNSKPTHEFQSGQAHMNYTTTTPSKGSTTNTAKSNIDTTYIGDENIEIVLEEATDEIKQTEVDQLAFEAKAIDTTTNKITNHVRFGIGKLFGNTLSSDEMEDVATQVQKQLSTEAQTTLRGKADAITKNAITKIENKVSTEEDNGYDESLIEENVLRDQKDAMVNIKSRIDSEATKVQQVLPTRAMEIEKAILEDRLSKKLGKRVKLVIDEENNEINANDDELFHDLESFTKPSFPTTGKTTSTTTTTNSGSSSLYSTPSSSYGSSSYGSSSSTYGSSVLPKTTTTTNTTNLMTNTPVNSTTNAVTSTTTTSTTAAPLKEEKANNKSKYANKKGMKKSGGIKN